MSEIIDMYPTNFKLDVNGNRFAWMGVNLLPFADKNRLLAAVKKREHEFNDDEKRRNTTGKELIIFNSEYHEEFKAKFEDDLKNEERTEVMTTQGSVAIAGTYQGFKGAPALLKPMSKPNHRLVLENIKANRCMVLIYTPKQCKNHKCSYLEGVIAPKPEIKEYEI